MDSTAYPHIIERIIRQCCSVAALLAFRATSRRCQAVADDTLFYHVVIKGEWIHPDQAPKGRTKKLLQRITGRLTARVYPEYRYFLELPASSPIELDVPRLPFLLRNVNVLDLDTSAEGEGPLARKMEELGLRAFTHRLAEGEVFAPGILRRHGWWAECGWAKVRDTTVDFVVGGSAAQGWWSYDRGALVPRSTPKYVIHLGWPAGWDPVDVDPESSMGSHIAHDENYGLGVYILSRLSAAEERPTLREATVVFSPHHAPPSCTTVKKVVIMATRAFMPSVVLDSVSFTVVGLEAWLPGIDFTEFQESLRSSAITACLARSEGGADEAPPPPPDLDTIAQAYDGIRFTTLEAWWEELGDMKDLVGKWPRHRCPVAF